MAAKKPNVLWICTDQQRWDTLGCYGNEFVSTPNLDRLAAQGVKFERAYCQSPVCTPSRASFLTGRYPRTTRCRQNGQYIPADEKPPTLGQQVLPGANICDMIRRPQIADGEIQPAVFFFHLRRPGADIARDW